MSQPHPTKPLLALVVLTSLSLSAATTSAQTGPTRQTTCNNAVLGCSVVDADGGCTRGNCIPNTTNLPADAEEHWTEKFWRFWDVL